MMESLFVGESCSEQGTVPMGLRSGVDQQTIDRHSPLLSCTLLKAASKGVEKGRRETWLDNWIASNSGEGR